MLRKKALRHRGLRCKMVMAGLGHWPLETCADTIPRELRVEEGFNSLRVVRSFRSLPARMLISDGQGEGSE